MFLINSRSHLVSATPISLACKTPHQQGHTFSRSYGVILPSSFTWVLSSPRYSLPVHLCRFTVRSIVTHRLEAFPGSRASTSSLNSLAKIKLLSRLRSTCIRIYLNTLPKRFHLDNHSPGRSSFLRHSIAATIGTGILTRFPSASLFSYTLGADLPYVD